MNEQERGRWVGARVAWAAGAVLLVLGALLLSIVGDPPRLPYAFMIGVGVVALGCVLILAGIEALWLRKPSSLSWRDALTGIVVAALILIVAGLLLQVLYSDKDAYLLLIAQAVPLTVVLAASYFGCRALINRLGV